MAPASASTAAGAQRTGAPLQLVTFQVGEEEFAVPILAVQEINRMLTITRVPESPACVEGVVNLRGRIIPVLDLRQRFGLAAQAHGTETRIIVAEIAGKVLGFTVDRVHEVLRLDRGIVEDAPALAAGAATDYLAGVARLDDRLIMLLDLEKLFGGPATLQPNALAA